MIHSATGFKELVSCNQIQTHEVVKLKNKEHALCGYNQVNLE